MKNNISFRIIGETEKLPADVLNRLNQCVQRTSKNTGMCLVLALSYSSKWEITKAVKEISEKVACGELNINDITDQTVSQYLATNFMPDPDLLIRTGGEIRLSNYMLWQCAYSELIFAIHSGLTSRKKNYVKQSVIINEENADLAKQVNKY